MAVYRSTSDPNTMSSFNSLPTSEKLRPTCMLWRSTTKGESKGTITLQAWAINHEADQGDLKAVLNYNSTSTPYKHGCVLRYKPCRCRGRPDVDT